MVRIEYMISEELSCKLVLSRIERDYPGVKLLALGQTIFWDEPTKAVLFKALEDCFPNIKMIAGIHDTDYFSKVPRTMNLEEGWHLSPHTDGASKDMWVAAAEISSLFGSETVPSREQFINCGISFDKLARDYPGGRKALIENATEAWGWRGLLHANGGSEIACEVRIKDALPHLIGLLEWGFSHTLETLSDEYANRGRRISEDLTAEIIEYAGANPESSITEMYRSLLPSIYGRLLGYTPSSLELTEASSLFRFNRETASLPRFKVLRAFLDPVTRPVCQEVYDEAVRGSDTYTLDKFPAGAIPFDLVVPGRGRGTICLRGDKVVIEFDEAMTLDCEGHPCSPEALADLINKHFGKNVSIIGKALTLVLMIAGEFIFVLNEDGSAYVPRCERLAALMKEHGIDLNPYPILRIGYRTWDSLKSAGTTFHLPGHLAAAFGRSHITSYEFADSWLSIVREQEALLDTIKSLNGISQILDFLVERNTEGWKARRDEYTAAEKRIMEMSTLTDPMKSESIRLRDLSHTIKQGIQRLEAEKGEHFRNVLRPLREDTSPESADALQKEEFIRIELENNINKKNIEADEARKTSLRLKNEVREIENSRETKEARDLVRKIENEAELAKMWLVRDAVLVSKGLKYTNHRPAAWWFLLCSPDMKWFNEVASNAEYRIEQISMP